jgi:hypothetical protein
MNKTRKPTPAAHPLKIGNYHVALNTYRNSSGIKFFRSSEYSEYSENGPELKKR